MRRVIEWWNVGTLRESIVLDSQRREKEREAGVNDVRDALGSSRVKVWPWEEVKEAVHRSEALVAGARPRIDNRDIEVGEIRVNMERKGRRTMDLPWPPR